MSIEIKRSTGVVGMTQSDAEAFAEDDGGRVPSRAELISYFGQSSGYTGDKWVWVSDE